MNGWDAVEVDKVEVLDVQHLPHQPLALTSDGQVLRRLDVLSAGDAPPSPAQRLVSGHQPVPKGQALDFAGQPARDLKLR